MKQRRGNPSFVIRAGIFLLLGAIVNVAVAWTGTLRSMPHESIVMWWGDWGGSGRTGVGFIVLDGWCRTDEFWYAELTRNLRAPIPPDAQSWVERAGSLPPKPEADRIVTRWLYCHWELRKQAERLPPYDQLFVVSAGWPLRSLNTDLFVSDRDAKFIAWLKDRWFVLHRAYEIGDTLLIPLKLIWPGFAINTLFYAAILWLLFTTRLTLPYARRRRRIKRGLCPACAYPVGASDLCTECGNKLNITSKIVRERMGLPPPATPALDAERTT